MYKYVSKGNFLKWNFQVPLCQDFEKIFLFQDANKAANINEFQNIYSKILQYQAGKTAVLECEADGFPSPKISWKRQDGKLLPNGDETLTNPTMSIPNVQRINKGVISILLLPICII